jgi:hypothetical protein
MPPTGSQSICVRKSLTSLNCFPPIARNADGRENIHVTERGLPLAFTKSAVLVVRASAPGVALAVLTWALPAALRAAEAHLLVWAAASACPVGAPVAAASPSAM